MNYRLIVKDNAVQDLRLLAEYILLNGSSDAATRFLEEAEMTFTQLAKMPKIGKVIKLVSSSLGEVRQWRVRNFADHLIFYQLRDTTVYILRVLHGARDLTEVLTELGEDL